MTVKFDILLSNTLRELLLLINNNKITVANISRQLGKSVLMKLLASLWLFEKNKTISYIVPLLKLGKKFFKDLVAVLPKELLITANASDLLIESKTGSSLWFYSAELGDRIRGTTNDYLIVDEAAFLKNSIDFYYSVLLPTTKVRCKKIVFVSTPNGTNNLFYEMATKAKLNNWGYIEKNIYDDSFCNDIEEIKRTTPDIIFRLEYLCLFIEGATSFFTNYHLCYIENDVFKNGTCWFGLDLSSVGQDETILTIINDDNLIILFTIGGSLNDKYRKIAELINKYKALGYAEKNSIGAVMINEIKKYTNNIREWTTTNLSKTDIITELAVALENGAISYSDKKLDKQLGSFGYSISNTGKMKFSGCHDDAVMSLAIALRAKKDLRNNKIVFI